MIEFINESKKGDNTKSVLIANQAVDSTLVHLKLDPDKFEIAILACDDEKMRELNFKFRGINNKTNILKIVSFLSILFSYQISDNVPFSLNTFRRFSLTIVVSGV